MRNNPTMCLLRHLNVFGGKIYHVRRSTHLALHTNTEHTQQSTSVCPPMPENRHSTSRVSVIHTLTRYLYFFNFKTRCKQSARLMLSRKIHRNIHRSKCVPFSSFSFFPFPSSLFFLIPFSFFPFLPHFSLFFSFSFLIPPPFFLFFFFFFPLLPTQILSQSRQFSPCIQSQWK